MCPVIVDQARTTVRRDFAPFSSAIFLWCLVRITLLRSCQTISFGLRSALWRGRSRRRIFLLLKPIYSCTLGHCPVASLSLSWASDGRQMTLHSPKKCIDYLSTYFAASMRLWCWYCMLSFSTYCFLLVFSGYRTFWHWRWGTSRCSIASLSRYLAQTDVLLSIWYSHYVLLCIVPHQSCAALPSQPSATVGSGIKLF